MTASRERHSYLRPDQQHALCLALRPIDEAFDHVGVIQVGSSLTRPDFRDVDVRMVMHDAEFVRLFGPELDQHYGNCTGLWALLCSMFSRRLSDETGMPVDFQIQAMSGPEKLNGGPRNGLFVTSAGLELRP